MFPLPKLPPSHCDCPDYFWCQSGDRAGLLGAVSPRFASPRRARAVPPSSPLLSPPLPSSPLISPP